MTMKSKEKAFENFSSSKMFLIHLICLCQLALVCTSNVSGIFDGKTTIHNRTIIKVSSRGNDSEICWMNASKPCQTISFALKKPNLNYTTILMSNENHQVGEKIEVIGFEDLELKSEASSDGSSSDITCKAGSFSFKRGTKLSLVSLTLKNCGTSHSSTSMINGSSINLSTALFLQDCLQVKLEQVTISGSLGMGAVFYDVGGNVSFSNVTFSDNKQIFYYKEKGLSSGGGIYIEFTIRSNNFSTVYNSKSVYTFQSCTFQSNIAENSFSYPSPDNDPKNFISFGRGGAVSLMFLGAATKNSFWFNNCTFRNNTALWGAGIFAEFHGQSGSNNISITNCIFSKNKASYGGGAVRTGMDSNNAFGYNLIQVKSSDFIKNEAEVGGGFSQYRVEKLGIEREVTKFEDCRFIENKALLGLAMHMSVSQFELHNVVLSGNIVDQYKEKTSGKGALYLFSSRGIFKNGNRIENNIWTGIVLEFSFLEFFDDVMFLNNSGINGGAIAAYAESWIVLRENSRVDFIENSAIRLGGALYVKTPGPPMAPMDSTEFMVYKCAIVFGDKEDHPSSFDTKVRFINNTAPIASGGSVFISTLTWCRQYGEQKYNNTALQWKNFFYEAKDNQPVIATNPVIMELYKEDWKPAPSMLFQPRIILRDELWHSAYGTVKVKIASTINEVKLKGSDVFAVKDVLPKISITGREGAVFNVTVETVVGVTVRGFLQDMSLDRCPLGYFQSGEDVSCKCLSTKGMEKGVTHCQGSDVYILRGRWGNPLGKNEDFAKHHCPRNYCQKCNKTGTDGIECIFEKKRQCGENRKWDSVLCGSCKPGYSVKLGNEECEKCSDSSLAWLILWLIALTIFVFIILILNVRDYFTYLNAYLYSYQVLPLLLVGNHYLDVFISFVMGLTNFSGTGGNVGVCLWDGMTDMEKLFLNYLTPFYIVTCVVFFVFLSSRWKRCPFNKESTLRALAMLSIFTYADFTRISFELVHYVSVDGRKVLYLEGDVEIFKGRHKPFGAIAIIVLVVIVILFPLCLIFFHIVTGCFVKLKGVIDAFLEPFKKGYERFVAFYLINRFALFAIFVFLESGLVRDTVLAIACEVILIVFLFIKPYKDEKMNYFDMLMLSNIAFVGTINVSLNAITEKENRRGLQVTAVVLTYLPLLCILLQFSHWVYIELNDWMARRKSEHSKSKFIHATLTYYMVKGWVTQIL